MSDTPKTIALHHEMCADNSPEYCYNRMIAFARDLERENAALRKECDKWKTQWQTTEDERASSFARLAKAVGGCSLTEYQPEIDLELEAAIKALRADEARLDWLVEQHRRDWRAFSAEPLPDEVELMVYAEDGTCMVVSGPTLRAAIDAALAGKEEGK